jgi:hypothetical protein
MSTPHDIIRDWAKDSVAIVLLPIKEKVVDAMSNISMNDALKLLLVFIKLSILLLLKFIGKFTIAHIKGLYVICHGNNMNEAFHLATVKRSY